MEIHLPKKLEGLRHPKRYKVLYGGRGGAKSWGVARQLLIDGYEKPLRILCAREYQNSITDSVHKLLSDQIVELGLSGFYDITTTSIKGKNGTVFGFQGIKHNITKLKSWEGCDRCWVEEAQTVSGHSWKILIPTIRKEGSEIWVTFNPELETDETYQRFVVNAPENAWVQKINWSDNDWFPDVLEQERLALQASNPDEYLNVWEGHCKQTLDGAIYANELRQATEDGRICSVPYDRSKPVATFWDLGWSDKTSIILAQAIGFEYRIIDFIEDRHKDVNHYLKVLNEKPYTYEIDWLPHDANAKTLQTGRSIKQIMQAAGRRVQVLPVNKIEHGINAARTIFNQCYFDEHKCADLLNHLRRYRYDINEETGQYSKKPLHDESSHAADAFRYLAMSLKQTKERKQPQHRPSAGGWMS